MSHRRTASRNARRILLALALFVIGASCASSAVARAPDRARIAFVSRRDSVEEFSGWRIYTMDADGGRLETLVGRDDDSFEPFWSPDGRWIAFHSEIDPSPTTEVYRMDAQGRNVERLTETPARLHNNAPAWSPDGKQIAFYSTRHKEDRRNAEIYAMDAAGGNIRRLTDHPKLDMHPAWAPNGRHIAFTSSRHGEGRANPMAIYLMDADGSNVRRLTMLISSAYASWAPGGGRIAFEGLEVSGGARDILSIDFDGSGRRNLTNHPAWDEMPSWSPTGREIAFSSRRDGNSEIYVMDATGENPRRLTSDPATDFQPNWFVPPAARAVSPQGKRPFTWGWLKQVAPSR